VGSHSIWELETRSVKNMKSEFYESKFFKLFFKYFTFCSSHLMNVTELIIYWI
jgi:hypothetical protein